MLFWTSPRPDLRRFAQARSSLITTIIIITTIIFPAVMTGRLLGEPILRAQIPVGISHGGQTRECAAT